MSQDQQFMSPEEQRKAFLNAMAHHLLTTDQGQSQDTPDAGAQVSASGNDTTAGIDNGIDYDKIKQMFQDIHTGLPMQDGDKTHPMDAIQQIGTTMYQPPEGANLATGPSVTQSPLGGLQQKVPNTSPWGRLLHLTKNEPIDSENYFQVAKDAGLMKYLPSGAAKLPDGSPLITKSMYDMALLSQKAIQGQGNQVYTSKAQLLAQGIPEDTANALIAANPQGVSNKEVTNYLGSERINSAKVMADARATMAGVAVLGQKLKVGGFQAAQPLVETSMKNIGLANRAQQAIDQITSSGGVANQAQRAELASALGSMVGQNSGVLTDEKMQQFMPQSAKAKFGNVFSYWTNENQPVDFTGFLPQLQDLLTREKQANQGMISAGQQLGINIMAQTQPKTAAALTNNLNANPLMGNAPIQPPSQQQGLDNPLISSYMQKNRIKDTPANRAWAAKKLGM